MDIDGEDFVLPTDVEYAAKLEEVRAEIRAKVDLINRGFEGFSWTRYDETPADAAWEIVREGYLLPVDKLRAATEVYIALRRAEEEGKAPDLAVLKQLAEMEPGGLQECSGGLQPREAVRPTGD